MCPKICPPRKTSLPSYSRKLRWTLIGPHLSPHPNTDSYQTFTTGPFSLLAWLHQAFFPFCTFSTRTCLRDSVPEMQGHMGPSSLLIQTTQSRHAQMATLSPGLGCNHPLNTWSPKTNLKRPLNVCSPHSFKDLLSHRAFLSLPRYSTTDPPRTPPRPIPFFYAL